jgi:hypothetical protein
MKERFFRNIGNVVRENVCQFESDLLRKDQFDRSIYDLSYNDNTTDCKSEFDSQWVKKYII